MVAKGAKKLFLIDAMGFIFRAYHAPMERLHNSAGIPTKVPYLFSNMLRRLIKDWSPDYLGVVFDVTAPTFRDKLFAEYKAQRPPMPEDLGQQLPYVRRLSEAMHLPILEYTGYEADDVIGALAKQAEGKKLDVYIVTSDKDMMQLVGGRVRVLKPGSPPSKGDTVIDDAKVEELMGVPPAKVADVMALMGDSIDNIPGAKGIGEKGARELIQRFGSVEAALDRAAEVEGKRYREALQNSRDAVILSKKLAIIATEVPVTLDLAALERQPPDIEALRALYIELGFTSLLKDLPAPNPEVVSAQGDYAQLESSGAVSEFLASIPPDAEVAISLSLAPGDRELAGHGSRVAAVEFSIAPGMGRSAWLDEGGAVRAALDPWLRSSACPKIVHDPKLVELLLGPGVTGIRHATALYSYLLRPTTAKHDLADVALRHLNTTIAGVPGESADTLQRLTPILRKEVEALGLFRVYDEIDLPLAPVLAEMERHGVLVDRAALAEMSETMEREVRSREKEIWNLALCEFNINSPVQLADILFDKLNLQVNPRRGRAKSRSTAAEILEELALLHELPRKVIDYREVSKLKSTYVDALPKLIDPNTGRIHTCFSQTGTATGRLSSADPNLQNIPIRTELGREIRAAFAAQRGWTLISADYSQIELRVLAHFSEDPVLVEAFRRGEDIHSRTAQEVFGVGPLMQTPEHRRVAKVINFGIIYGLSAFGLAQNLGIEQKEAAKFIAAYFERYAGVKKYLDRSLAEARKNGASRTLFGRMRPLPEINSPQVQLRNFAERTALNTPLQGTAADLIKRAMIDLARRFGEEKLETKMILQVHDELLFETPPRELSRVRQMVKEAMENVEGFDGPLKVPIVVDIKSGPNWRDME